MPRWLSHLFIIILIIIMALVGISFALPWLIGMDRIKREVEARVEEETGRQFTIKGEVTPSLSLHPSVTAHGIALKNASWAKNPQLLTAETVTLRLDLIALLQGQFIISDLTLAQVTLFPERSAKGSFSWEFTPKAPHLNDEPGALGDQTNQEVTLAIHHATLEDGAVTYIDQGSKQTYQLAITSLVMDGLDGSIIDSFALDGALNGADLDVTGSLQNSTLMIDGALEGSGFSLTAKGGLEWKNPALDFMVNAKADQLRQLLAPFGIKHENSQPVAFAAHISGMPEMINLKDLSANYGPYHAKGAGTLELSKNRPAFSGNLAVDALDFRSKSGEAETAGQGESQDGPIIPDAPIQTSWMHQLDLSLDLAIETIQLDKLTLKDFSTKLVLSNARLLAEPITFSTQEGWVESSLELDGKTAPPSIRFTALTRDLVLEKLLDAMGEQNRIQGGPIKSTMDITGQGNSLHQLIASSQGSFNLYLDKATYSDPPLVKKTSRFIELLMGKENDAIKVACLVGNFSIDSGVATARTLALKTSGAIVTGNGSINLANETLNLTLVPRSGVIGFADLVPPLTLKGPWRSPTASADPTRTLLGIGKLIIGGASGVGLAAVLGEQMIDKMGITSDNNPCLSEISQELAEQAEQPQDMNSRIAPLEDAVRKRRDDISQELRDLKNQGKALEDGFKNLLKKPSPE